MPLSIGVSGASKLGKPSIGVSGVWKGWKSAWIGVGGAWKKFYDSILVQLFDQSLSDDQTAPTDASVSLAVNAGGTVSFALGGGGSTTLHTWLLVGSAGDYEVMATQTSGTVSSGTVSTWLNCGTTRSWSVVFTSNNGTKTCTLTIQIRDVATGTVQATCTVTLTAHVEP